MPKGKPRKILSAIHDILGSWHHVAFESLSPAYRQTLIGAAEKEEREARSKNRPADVNWAIEECYLGLRDYGLLRVVDETISYFFPEVMLTPEERETLLRVAQDADRDGLVVRAMIEEAFRAKQIAKRIED